MKRALLIGNRGGLHDVEAASRALCEVFMMRYRLHIMDETRYQTLTYKDLAGWDLVIFMPDRYRARPCRDTTQALVTYVAWGGCLLSLHTGLITGGAFELDLMHAARFTGHEAYGTMDYVPGPCAGAHTQIAGDISIKDEPYTFEFDPMKKTHVLLEQTYAERRWPAAWAHAWAKGKVGCVAPGHDEESIRALGPVLIDMGDWFEGTVNLGEGGQA